MTFLESVPLAGKTSYGIGGPARYYVEPQSQDDVVAAYRFARERDLPVLVIGNGSNLLISDSGVDGLVINTSKFSTLTWVGPIATVTCGYHLDDFVADAVKRGYAGIEGLSGIPGTVGGAVVMNAGAFDAEVADTLSGVCVLRVPELSIELVRPPEMALGYRTSVFKNSSDFIISAVFMFKAGDADKLISSRKSILAKRQEKQPLDSPSCGSVFKRPPGNYAGTLIESSGLKGFGTGGAKVSEKHANFIINTGGAKAEDVRGVIRHVQKTVYEDSGILLEPEVIFVGEFKEPLFGK